MLEVDQSMVMEWAEWQLPTFTKASQNVAMAAVLLDTLLLPSTNRVGEVPTAEEHPQHHRHAASGEFPATSGRGLCFAPRLSLGRGTKGHPRDSGCGSDFLTDRTFSLRSFKPTRHSVGTSGLLMAPPSGRWCTIPVVHVKPTPQGS
jgi:hypothetical protein